MSTLRIHLDADPAQYRPGDPITGRVAWQLTDEDHALEIRLFWHTEGKGTTDVEIVEVQRLDDVQPTGEQTFRFIAPAGPYSFSGRLISLIWAIELVALPSNDADRARFNLSSTGEEVRITQTITSAEPGA